MNIKLTKTELEYLTTLLETELDLSLRDLRRHSDSKSISNALNLEIKKSNSILKKLTITKR